MALSKTTQDHDEIRQWAEARGGKPAEVASTEKNGETGIIRFMFPNAPHHNDSALKEIEWDEFFEKFDKSGLALVYQDVTAEGAQSDFNKLIHPENASASATSSRSAPAKRTSGQKASGQKTPAKKTPAKKTSAKSSAKKSSPAAAKSAPRKTPAKKAPAKKAPAKKSPAKKTPAKQTPAKKAPAKKSAVRGTVSKTPARGAKTSKGTKAARR